ncbi:MAG: universal stress protein [Solirubrobacteraceae bacterium]|jgi:nucleotide-binding universal stress UspA family protein
MFQRILIAWDGSELSLRAFDAAIDVARRYGAELVAVSVAYSPAHAETDADRRESSDASRRYLQESFSDVADRAERVGTTVEHTILDGEAAADVLVAYAREHGFDLIVCGHHHSRRAGRLLLHGVADRLLEDGRIPLLVIGDNHE